VNLVLTELVTQREPANYVVNILDLLHVDLRTLVVCCASYQISRSCDLPDTFARSRRTLHPASWMSRAPMSHVSPETPRQVRSANLRNDHVSIEPSIRPIGPHKFALVVDLSLQPDEHVLLCVVQPVSCASGPDDTLQLISLHPDDLINTSVSPVAQAFAANLHRSSSHPEEEKSFVLEGRDRHRSHLVVSHRTIWELW
jgi:hypothetical protein